MSACYYRNCGVRAARLVGDGIYEVCERYSSTSPKNVLIAVTLIVYIGVSMVAYIRDHPSHELTVKQRERVAEGQRPATRTAMVAGYVD